MVLCTLFGIANPACRMSFVDIYHRLSAVNSQSTDKLTPQQIVTAIIDIIEDFNPFYSWGYFFVGDAKLRTRQDPYNRSITNNMRTINVYLI